MVSFYKRLVAWLLATDLTPRQRVEELGLRFPAAAILLVFSALIINLFIFDVNVTLNSQLGALVLFTGIAFALVLILLIHLRKINTARAFFIIGLFFLTLITAFSTPDLFRSSGTILVYMLQMLFTAIHLPVRLYIPTFLFTSILLFGIQWTKVDIYTAVIFTSQTISGGIVIVTLNYLVGILRKNLDDLDTLNQSQLDILSSMADQERSASEQKEQLSLIIDSVADGLVVLNQSKNVYIINDVALRMIRRSRKEVIDKYHEQVLHFIDDRDKDKRLDFIDDLYESGKIFTSTQHTLLELGDDINIPVGVSVAPLKNNKNVVTSCVLIIRDETEERRQDQMKSDFVSVASHQLRTPLTAIKWNVDLLKDLVQLDETSSQVVKDVKDSTERMIALVGSLLDLSRIERNISMDMNMAKFNFIEIVEAAVKENKVNAQAVNIEIVTQMPHEFILSGDKNKLFQVVNNLISNAVKYSHPHSEVKVNFKQSQSQIVLEVVDSGIGIPEYQQKRIFKKFFRADNAIKHKAEGNGIGLYLAKSYIEAHNGLLTFVSIEGRGTTFVIALPYKADEKSS